MVKHSGCGIKAGINKEGYPSIAHTPFISESTGDLCDWKITSRVIIERHHLWHKMSTSSHSAQCNSWHRVLHTLKVFIKELDTFLEEEGTSYKYRIITHKNPMSVSKGPGPQISWHGESTLGEYISVYSPCCYSFSYVHVLNSWGYWLLSLGELYTDPVQIFLLIFLWSFMTCKTLWDTDQTNRQTYLPPAFPESACLGLYCLPANDSHLFSEEPGNLLY